MLELIDGLSHEQQQVLTLKFVFNFANGEVGDDPRQDARARSSRCSIARSSSLQKQIEQGR